MVDLFMDIIKSRALDLIQRSLYLDRKNAEEIWSKPVEKLTIYMQENGLLS